MLFEKFHQKIVNNNTIIGTIKSSELFNINIEIPNIQRILDKDKVNDILKYYINNFKPRDIQCFRCYKYTLL